ncbi:MAG TPA: zinc-dependent metalloprotease [Acidimicrobiia bacterium]|nr:zinc-dependent metalloprotease [Acidimicrobiia bacterium]
MTTPPRSGSGRLVGRIAGTYPLAATYHLAALETEMIGVTATVSELVPEATGLELPGKPSTVVIGRSEWVERNLASFSHLIEPVRLHLEERVAESGPGAKSAAALASRLMQVEMAAVLGFLARRVLGQYELVLPTGEDGDVVAFVGPNIMNMERTHQFRPAEFRFWVALHEMTHRAQFQGIPWLRDYFMGLVSELVDQSIPEPGRINRMFGEMASRRESGAAVLDERGLLGLFATPEQSAVIDKVQALMCLLEGHGHVVMDRLGRQHLKSQERMSRVLKNRKLDKRTAAFFRITGLEMKLNQYKMGEQFVQAVEKEAGWDTLNLAFRGVGSLPTLAEIEGPKRWLQRVA